MCSVDWVILKDILVALIGAGIPSVVAVCVFLRWKNQKGSEVIANEAKSLIIKIAKLQSLQAEIFKLLNQSDDFKFPEDEFSEFKKTKNELSDSMNFLGFALKHDKSLSQLPSIVGAQALLFIRDIGRYKEGVLDINSKSFNMINSNDAFTLSEILLDYAMYKKSISRKRS
ncbi:hypothetical protein [Acinetobacter ursingii]|uniref:hypothetical protein n=1 Tax=Acinetobacter ursingii TaxID=108980 RepID=UPI0030097187